MLNEERIWSRLIGQLRLGDQHREFEQLQEYLPRVQLPQDLQQLKGSDFSFESADLFSPDRVGDIHRGAIDRVVENKAAAEYRLFVREVPLRSTQLHGSNPLWASGSTPEKSFGPFLNQDGRRFWFDLFRIEKLVALYVQGVAEPALLFKIRVGFQFIDLLRPLSAEAHLSYRLSAGSIWINSRLLASNAPCGFYTGLTIRGGTISLSAAPTLIDNRLTMAATTTARVQLELLPVAATGADPASPYGADARSAELELPGEFAFHFTGASHGLDNIGRASWQVYGHRASFEWRQQQGATYNAFLNRVLIPLTASTETFEVRTNESPFHTLGGSTKIVASYWALPSAAIDVAQPTAAEGIGAVAVLGGPGLSSGWTALRGGPVNLKQPFVMAAPGRISVSDPTLANALCHQDFNLWRDQGNPYGTTAKFQYLSGSPFFFNTVVSGSEVISTVGNADVRADRPVTARGEPLEIRSKQSLLLIAATTKFRLFQLFDDTMLADNLDPTQKPAAMPAAPISLVLSNALFKTTAVNGCLLFGTLAEDFVKVDRGFLYLTLGLHAYLPTLPDPYAANVDQLKFQFRGANDLARFKSNQPAVWMLLVCQIKWEPAAAENDKVDVSFHFAPLSNLPAWVPEGQVNDLDFAAYTNADPKAGVDPQARSTPRSALFKQANPNYNEIWKEMIARLPVDQFALLDVSTNADLLGVSFGTFGGNRMTMMKTLQPADTGFPLQVKGMEVVSRGMNVRAFTVPQISWEPVINLTAPPKPTAPVNPFDPSPARINDPPFGPNYYPDDGGPTRVINNSAETVALAPIPLTNFLVESFAVKPNFAALSVFTLPFGMRALALLQTKYSAGGIERPGANLQFNAKKWASGVTGARQLQTDGGAPLREGESDMFMGSTLQMNNILDLNGVETGASTLGESVTDIFNNEFMLDPPQIIRQRGVPLSRMDLSGYGASIFSNWLNPKAAIAETSQAKFDVFVGRCAHEIIQVRSIVYPYAIKVVRTITLFRTNSAYCYRFDTGWRPESDGRFDFTYFAYNVVKNAEGKMVWVPEAQDPGYPIHPGIVRGLFHVSNIREVPEIQPFLGDMQFPKGQMIVDPDGQKIANDLRVFPFELQPVYFDADVELENPVSGFVSAKIEGVDRKLVPSKRILGFVQIRPRGILLSAEKFHELIVRQAGSIGGPVDCVVKLGGTEQQMRLSRFDLSNAAAAVGGEAAFAGVGRGSVLLPKDGAWSVVKHEFATGQVSPVPQDMGAPLIRVGKLFKDGSGVLKLSPPPDDQLLRIADPAELLRASVSGTINYGFLQSTETQRALFLTPAFGQKLPMLLSKTPPLFADAFRIVNSKAIFPNIGNAVGNFGDAISLFKNGNEFDSSGVSDNGNAALKLMTINDGVKKGYKLAKKFPDRPFELPNKEWELINLNGALRIYLEYKADNIQGARNPDFPKAPPPTRNAAGQLDYNVDSFAPDVGEQWKSKMSNLGVVVDLGPIKRLMTIKGNWDSQKGGAVQYGGNSAAADFPSPQIEFAPELQPVIEILQILQDLQGLNYKAALQQGLKLAMSNKAGSWEYKFEATKEIPVLKFPMPPFDNDPNAPMKLEAGLRLGVYFNSAIKVSSDPKDLLPTAGAFFGFYGRMSVMCVSLSVATVYAVGQVTLDIAADSKVGPSLRMKFGFGAQIVIGLPVVGNVSVLYMVGVEIYTDSTQLNVSSFLLYQGHAELAAGLISVTITIEAKGTVKRLNDRTDLEVQVTFGLDISVFLVLNISFSKSWSEQRQIA